MVTTTSCWIDGKSWAAAAARSGDSATGTVKAAVHEAVVNAGKDR